MEPSHNAAVSLLIILLVATAWSGCLTEESAAVVLYVKGTPHDEFEELFVTFDEIRAHRTGAEADADDTEGPGWVTLTEGPIEIDLLEFTLESAQAIIANATIDRGRYDQIIFSVSKAAGTLTNKTQNATVEPAEDVTRVSAPFSIESGTTTAIYLTIDVGGSLEGSGELHRFSPVVAEVTIDEDAQQLHRSVRDDGVPHGGEAPSDTAAARSAPED